MLLLCSTLGDESSRPLSYAQFRTLAERARALGPGGADLRRDLTAKDLTRLGYAPEEAERIEDLLSREAALHAYLSAAERRSIFPLTRITPGYPAALRALLGDRAPLVLFLRGEPSLLELPCISVVDSRQPNERTRGFARRIGALAAKEGFVLCSGGAGGVDTEAEDACLGGGGRVIVFPAGRLTDCRVDARVLYLTEGAYDVPFSAQRALARNRLIHALGERTYAAQPRMQTGGTWRGCTDHLHSISRPLFVFDDGSEAARALLADGASPIGLPETLFAQPEPQLRLDL